MLNGMFCIKLQTHDQAQQIVHIIIIMRTASSFHVANYIKQQFSCFASKGNTMLYMYDRQAGRRCITNHLLIVNQQNNCSCMHTYVHPYAHLQIPSSEHLADVLEDSVVYPYRISKLSYTTWLNVLLESLAHVSVILSVMSLKSKTWMYILASLVACMPQVYSQLNYCK